MKISALIQELIEVRKQHGEIEVCLQDKPDDPETLITNTDFFFIVPEQYDDGWQLNIRTWPY